MNKYYYDLHVHSCLSACGDEDNTPHNIAAMASINGLNIVALTDHNTCKNCPAFFKAAKKYGIIPVAGMELTTAEDIHIVCLFETLEQAMLFDAEVDSRRIKIKNRPDIFGEQLILDHEDNLLGVEEDLLSNATTISTEEAPDIVAKFGGVCYPAHIDRDANGIIAILGTFPETPHFSCVEFHFREKMSEYTEKYNLSDKRKIVCSDAHYLTDMNENENFIELHDEPYSSAFVRSQLIKFLKGDI